MPTLFITDIVSRYRSFRSDRGLTVTATRPISEVDRVEFDYVFFTGNTVFFDGDEKTVLISVSNSEDPRADDTPWNRYDQVFRLVGQKRELFHKREESVCYAGSYRVTDMTTIDRKFTLGPCNGHFVSPLMPRPGATSMTPATQIWDAVESALNAAVPSNSSARETVDEWGFFRDTSLSGTTRLECLTLQREGSNDVLRKAFLMQGPEIAI